MRFTASWTQAYQGAGKGSRARRPRPDLAIGYAYLADALAGSKRRPGTAEGRERAIALLEAALAHPVQDAEDFSLRERLRDLRAR